MFVAPAALLTPRLQLRPWRADDAPALSPLLVANFEQLIAWIPAHVATPAPLPELAERLTAFGDAFTANRDWRYAMLRRDNGLLLGEFALFPRDASSRVHARHADRVEFGYWLRGDAYGLGFVTEAANAIRAMIGAHQALCQLEIRCDARNSRSGAVPARLGFTLTNPGAVAKADATLMQLWTYPIRATRA
jgi:RimJ/RimL family protein N-acetyltransferase